VRQTAEREDTRMNLRRYNADVVLSAAGQLWNRFESGDLNWIELALALSELKFRDDAGDYWFLDACASRWYRFDQLGWRAVSDTPEVLESVASLLAGRLALPKAPDFDAEFDESWAEGSAVKALEGVTRMVRSAYATGEVSSLDAEQLLRRHRIVDRRGRFWTVGVRSGQWYRFEGGVWAQAEAPPPADSLLRLEMPGRCEACGHEIDGKGACPECGVQVVPVLPDVSDEVYAGIFDFFLLGGSLPEPVTEPWEPPAGFPEGVVGATGAPQGGAGRPCGACGATNSSDRRFCSQCGVSLTSVDCPDCGAQVGAGKRFCTQCGAPLI
jgi:hypothetical protein